jgi:hypothetical protein
MENNHKKRVIDLNYLIEIEMFTLSELQSMNKSNKFQHILTREQRKFNNIKR